MRFILNFAELAKAYKVLENEDAKKKCLEVVEEAEVPLENITVSVYALDDTLVTDTLTNVDGMFMVQGLAAGSYKLKIEQEGYEIYESDEIVVTAGEVLDVGTIQLILVE